MRSASVVDGAPKIKIKIKSQNKADQKQCAIQQANGDPNVGGGLSSVWQRIPVGSQAAALLLLI
ncbi:hypothetical protein AO260_22565 [Pseudomonas sp. ABAC21]|nr:hypothetical protein AO260_22565 [Pseudomonas sp. ABAC21]